MVIVIITVFRIISDNVSFNLRFKTTSVMGLLLWYGNINRNNDFLSLGVVNGYLHLSYNEGNGEVSLLCNTTRVDDGHWHRVNIFKYAFPNVFDNFTWKCSLISAAENGNVICWCYCREVYAGSLMVDNGDAIVSRSTGPLRQINADSGLYIGEETRRNKYLQAMA